ncbi:MAG: TOBE domain-containing protein, partial [Pseudorhodobacter sp.]|nr:TOBE domain-containing protein [Pseudorhodobacter sp.]
PVNRFVASFIGETNFLPVTATPQGARLSTGDVTAAEGEGTILIVRPEQLRLGPAGVGAGLAAKVTGVVYFGTDIHVNLSLSDGTGLTARVPSPVDGGADFATGQAVAVTFQPGAARLIRE